MTLSEDNLKAAETPVPTSLCFHICRGRILSRMVSLFIVHAPGVKGITRLFRLEIVSHNQDSCLGLDWI